MVICRTGSGGHGGANLGVLLALYFCLACLPFAVERCRETSQIPRYGMHFRRFRNPCVFFSWRVWRGGTISWALLLLVSIWNLATTVMGAIAPWSLSIYAQAALEAIQLALMFSPAIWHNLGSLRREHAG